MCPCRMPLSRTLSDDISLTGIATSINILGFPFIVLCFSTRSLLRDTEHLESARARIKFEQGLE